MSKSLYISILLPVKGYTGNRIYDDGEVALDTFMGGDVGGKYVRKLRVRSRYAEFGDIVQYAVKKYALGDIKDKCLQYHYDGSETLICEKGRYDVSAEEIKKLEKEHIHENTYCKQYKSFGVDVYLYDILTKLVPDDPVVIDSALVEKAVNLIEEGMEDEETENLENFFDYGMGYEGKLVASMLVAMEIAKRKGGIAVMEYD